MNKNESINPLHYLYNILIGLIIYTFTLLSIIGNLFNLYNFLSDEYFEYWKKMPQNIDFSS